MHKLLVDVQYDVLFSMIIKKLLNNLDFGRIFAIFANVDFQGESVIVIRFILLGRINTVSD